MHNQVQPFLGFGKNAKLADIRKSSRYLTIAADKRSYMVPRESVAPSGSARDCQLVKTSAGMLLAGNAFCLLNRLPGKINFGITIELAKKIPSFPRKVNNGPLNVYRIYYQKSSWSTYKLLFGCVVGLSCLCLTYR